jgi:hypothetical protein
LFIEGHENRERYEGKEMSIPDLDQLRVQLAGCLTAAEGWGIEVPAKQGDYGWSPAYQATLELRRMYETLLKEKTVDNCELCAAQGEPVTKEPIEEKSYAVEPPAGFLLVKVGSDCRPATDEDIEDVEQKVRGELEEKYPNLPIVVTHHNVQIEFHPCY